MTDIYSAPTSELAEESTGSEFGSVEKGISGDYSLTIGDTIRAAWASTKGAKTTILVALLLYLVCLSIIQFGLSFIVEPMFGETVSSIVVQLVVSFLTAPLNVGIGIIAIRRMANAGIRSTSIFDHFGKIIPLFLCMLLMYLLIFIGFLLLILPGIYLSMAYMFAMPLIVEKNMGIWQALETSRKAVTHKWFVIFFTFVVVMLLVMLSAIPLLIGLIWTVPLMVLTMGKIYLTLFGINKSTLDSE